MVAGTEQRKPLMAIFSVFTFFLMWVAMTANKVSLVWLMRLHRFDEIRSATWYCIVCVILVAPQVFTLLHITWKTPFICVMEWTKWPKPFHLFLGVLASIVEMVALTVLMTEVAPVLPEHIFLLLPGSVLSVSLIVQQLQKCFHKASPHLDAKPPETTTKASDGSKRRSILKCMVAAIGLWAPSTVASLLFIGPKHHLQLYHVLLLPSAIFLLSVLWTPKVQEDVLRSADGSLEGRWKTSILYAVVKLAAVPFSMAAILLIRFHDLRGGYFFEFIAHGFHEFAYFRVWFGVVSVVVAGFLVMCAACACAKVGTTTVGMFAPTVLSTPAAIILCFYQCKFVPGSDLSFCHSRDAWAMVATALSVAVWLAPLVSGGVALAKPSRVLLKPFGELFLQFSWSSLCLEQGVILNYRPEGLGDPQQADAQWRSKVFICTTMYNECALEMRRLLASLEKVARSERLAGVYTEAHIFMDDGTKDSRLTDNAQRLMSVVFQLPSINRQSEKFLETPYGSQMKWTLGEGFPLFIHLKDSVKIKSKKRWSQVMYMNYILAYRCKLINKGRLLKERTKMAGNEISVGLCSDKEWRQNKEMLHKSETGCHKVALIDLELERLRRLLNARKQDASGDIYISPISMSIAQLLKLLKTRKDPVASLTEETKSSSEESSGEESTEPSEAYTVSRDSSEQSDIIADVDADISSDDGEMPYGRRVSNDGYVFKNPIALPAKPSPASGEPPTTYFNYGFDFRPHRNGRSWGSRDRCAETKMSAPTVDIFTVSGEAGVSEERVRVEEDPHFDDCTYILATDADMDFDDTSLLHVLDLCNRNKQVGGACGRTRPVGFESNPIVWYQKFEYAKDFWMIKSSQNVIGSVMCCPGCFSLYRAAAVRDVMDKYREPTSSPFDVFIKDHGEDRWMCTLMMLNGWKLEYTSYSQNSTFCPDSFLEFLKQRKRWVLSEVSNLVMVFRNLRRLARQNSTFSVIYMLYIFQMFLLVLLSPGTTVVVLTASLDILFGVSCVWTTPLCFLTLVFYTILCSTKPIRTQAAVTMVITIMLGLVMLAVSIGYIVFIATDTINHIQEGYLEFKQYYLLLILVAGVLYAACIHPSDSFNLVHGLVFLLAFPAMYILLPFYAVANIVDQKWGTRDQNESSGFEMPVCRCTVKAKSGSGEESAEPPIMKYKPENMTPLKAGSREEQEEHAFWERLRATVVGRDVNLGTDSATMAHRLKALRNKSVVAILLFNLAWLTFLTSMYMVIPRNDSVFGFIACAVYSFSLVIQLIGMTVHKFEALFRRFVISTFGERYPVWIQPRKDR